MKKYSQSYFYLFLFDLLFILVGLSYANSIEKEIIIEGNNPFVKMKIGNQKDKKLLISFSSPSIITFPKVKDSSFVPKNGTGKIKFKSKELKFKIEKGNFTLNDKMNNISISFGSMEEHPELTSEINGFDGILGLSKKEMNDSFNKETFLSQLIAKKYISKKIVYIGLYYNNTGKLQEKSKIKIGEFPEEFKDVNMHSIPLIENKDGLGYDCSISDLIIEDKLNQTKDNKTYNARIEEGQLEPISIPKSLFEFFKNHFSKKCTTENYNIICSNETIRNSTNIKFKIKDSNFQLGSIWDGKKLNLKFIDGNTIILTSEFTGNYHRIYDGNENKIFFSDFRGYSSKKKSNDILKIALIAGGALLIIAIIVIFIVVCVQRAKGKNLKDKVNTISFKADTKEEEDDEESLLY